MNTIIVRAILLAAACSGSASASFKSGYTDNQCTVTIVSVAKENIIGYTSSDQLLINYKYACPGSVNYTFTGRQSKYQISSDTKVNTCFPERFSTSKAPGYDEVKKSVIVYYDQYPGVSTCADLTLPSADGAFTFAPFPDRTTQLVTWSTPAEASSANTLGAKYNPADFVLETPFGNAVLPAKTFTGSGSSWSDQDARILELRWFMKIKYAKDSKYFATVTLLPGFNNGDYYDKPIIVGDAFDPFNDRGATTLTQAPQYQNLLSAAGPRGRGYDIYFINFSQGGGDIHINAAMELKFLEWLTVRSKDKIVLGGPSMSGVVARLSLLYSMPANNTAGIDYGTGVKGFLSIDSPMQGASISSSLQSRMYELKDKALSQISDFFGISSAPGDNWKKLSVPAAHQMLYEHHFPDGSDPKASHDAFYSQLKSMGDYRKDLPTASIAYSNFYQNWYPGKDVLIIGAIVNPPALDGLAVFVRNQEFYPGSTGDWYWDGYKAQSPSFMEAQNYGNPQEKFKGTFIPIQSALDLSATFSAATVPASDWGLAVYSPFQFIYYMKNPYNGYCNTSNVCRQLDANPRRTTIEDKRYVHIIFDQALINTINQALADIETAYTARISVPTLIAGIR